MDIGLGVSIDLTIAWAILLAFAVYIYVVLDGFDLGIGILYPAFPDKEDRDLMMNTVAPVWDGNETWLVLGGGGLFAAFPMAYAIIMPALYPPIVRADGTVRSGRRHRRLDHDRGGTPALYCLRADAHV